METIECIKCKKVVRKKVANHKYCSDKCKRIPVDKVKKGKSNGTKTKSAS